LDFRVKGRGQPNQPAQDSEAQSKAIRSKRKTPGATNILQTTAAKWRDFMATNAITAKLAVIDAAAEKASNYSNERPAAISFADPRRWTVLPDQVRKNSGQDVILLK
jgi:hypothetical protein